MKPQKREVGAGQGHGPGGHSAKAPTSAGCSIP